MAKARAKINDEFKKHKLVQNEGEIPELIAVAKEVEYFYRTRVVQAVPTEDGKHSKFIKCSAEILRCLSYFSRTSFFCRNTNYCRYQPSGQC